MDKTTLYIRDSNGLIREWSITAFPDEFLIEHGVRGGSMQSRTESVPRGKQGRTVAEQVLFQVQSRINKQQDKGYVFSLAGAREQKATNALGLAKPMLAKKYRDVRLSFSDPVFVQRKYDGNRCIIHNQDGKLIAYSRNGKPITSIGHIFDGLKIPEGMAVDGELYAHGHKLQEIVSWIKREQPDTLKLKYHAYDVLSSDPFHLRFRQLLEIEGNIALVPTYQVSSMNEIMEQHALFRSEGYEGTIIRQSLAGYEDGKRSSSLVKIKDWSDEEFEVIDVERSKEGWGLLVCKQSDGGPNFRVVAPGTHEDKREAYVNRDNLVGKFVTVEYVYRTMEGVPFHPVAKNWRSD